MTLSMDCPRCEGDGQTIGGLRCGKCNGEGTIVPRNAANALRRLESLPEGAHEILFVKHRGQWIFVVKESHHKTEHLGTS